MIIVFRESEFTDCGSHLLLYHNRSKILDDFKGLPIRVQNNQLMNSMVSLPGGGNPVNVATK